MCTRHAREPAGFDLAGSFFVVGTAKCGLEAVQGWALQAFTYLVDCVRTGARDLLNL
jgi:hypothetical protein